MSELKPCPFCGGKAEVIQRVKRSGFRVYKIYCFNCGIGTEESLFEKMVYKQWNRRINNE